MQKIPPRPVNVAKNAPDDMVGNRFARDERDQARLELYGLLDETESDVSAGDRGIGISGMRRHLGWK